MQSKCEGQIQNQRMEPSISPLLAITVSSSSLKCMAQGQDVFNLSMGSEQPLVAAINSLDNL